MTNYIQKKEFNDSSLGIVKIDNINFSKLSDLVHFNWVFVKASHELPLSRSSFPRFKESTYIYKNPNDSTKGVRIYEDYADYKYSFHIDHRMIMKLQEKQPCIKLTEFPTGIVTIEDKIIGQQIPYYDNYTTIEEVLEDNLSEEIFYDYIRKVIDIFKELSENGILYMDIHSGNILVNLMKNNDVKLIDFENSFMHINEKDHTNSQKEYLRMLKMLLELFKKVSEHYDMELLNMESDFNSIDDLYQIIPSKGNILIKK